MVPSIGILAFGSLIDNPGPELEPVIINRKFNVLTPFRVEFARKSKTRKGAPTLVPVAQGGSQVPAQILILDLDEQEAKDRLWRRETDRVGQGRHYDPNRTPGPDTLIIDRYENLEGVATVLAARFPANLASLNAKHLAQLAIKSARLERTGQDGISYLINTKRNGIVTPLSTEYEQEILRLTQTPTLREALQRIQS